MSFSKIALFFIFIPNLNFADLDGGFSFISFTEGTIGFFLFNLNKMSPLFVLGMYLEILFFSDKLLKKYFTILSSNELKVITTIFPPGFKILVAFIKPKIN